MAEEKKKGTQEVVGSYSLRKDIAEGVYLIISHIAIKAVVVTQTVAQKFLSPQAFKYGEPYGENNSELYYPAKDGRASIPMMELASKNYIKLHSNQIKEHFNNLVKRVPSYLRERGFIKPREIQILADKAEDEYKDYRSILKFMPKKVLIARAEEIVAFDKMKEYFESPDFPLEKQGILLSIPHLFETVYNELCERNLDANCQNFNDVVHDIKNDYEKYVYEEEIDCVENAISGFKAEIKVAKESPINSVKLQVDTPQAQQNFSMDVENFQGYISDETKLAFSKEHMLDFPTPDYYGEKYKDLYNALFLKRFSENIQTNFNTYAPANDIKLTVKEVSKEKANNSQYDNVVGCFYMKQYVEANYKNPQKYIENIEKTINKNREIMKSMNELLKEEPKEQVQEEPVVEETIEQETEEFEIQEI